MCWSPTEFPLWWGDKPPLKAETRQVGHAPILDECEGNELSMLSVGRAGDRKTLLVGIVRKAAWRRQALKGRVDSERPRVNLEMLLGSSTTLEALNSRPRAVDVLL